MEAYTSNGFHWFKCINPVEPTCWGLALKGLYSSEEPKIPKCDAKDHHKKSSEPLNSSNTPNVAKDSKTGDQCPPETSSQNIERDTEETCQDPPFLEDKLRALYEAEGGSWEPQDDEGELQKINEEIKYKYDELVDLRHKSSKLGNESRLVYLKMLEDSIPSPEGAYKKSFMLYKRHLALKRATSLNFTKISRNHNEFGALVRCYNERLRKLYKKDDSW